MTLAKIFITSRERLFGAMQDICKPFEIMFINKTNSQTNKLTLNHPLPNVYY